MWSYPVKLTTEGDPEAHTTGGRGNSRTTDHREVLVDQRVRHQLAHRRFGKLRDGPAQRRPDLLAFRQPGVDVADQPLEAGGVPRRLLAFSQRLGAAPAAVLDDPRGLARQRRKIAEVPGEQDGAQVRDVEAAGLTRRDEPVLLQRLENRGPAVGQRLAEQVEVRRVVEPEQGLFAAQPFRRDPILEARPVEPAPERAFLLRIVLELALRAADPDELDALERHRPVRGAVDLQKHDAPLVDRDFPEAKVDPRIEQAQQPRFQRLGALLRRAGRKACADHRVRAVLDSPQHVRARLVVQGRCVRQRRHVLADGAGIALVDLELHPLGPVRQPAQLPHQAEGVVTVPAVGHVSAPVYRLEGLPGSAAWRSTSPRGAECPQRAAVRGRWI